MTKLSSPKLDWKNEKTPLSERFDDVYFSVDDGIAESNYVFVHGCGLPEAFNNATSFTIGETGFGTGLNFLLTWKAWKESKTDCHLHFISVEAFPLNREELSAAYQAFPELADYCNIFLSQYPELFPGYNHIVLEEGSVTLTLMFGDVVEMYSQMDCVVDAWYLDGFAPAKNPEMWRDEVFYQMGRLSRPGTVLSTFTAAGFVKRGLNSAGFEMKKRSGYGRKRDSLIGTYGDRKYPVKNKWFIKPTLLKKSTKIAVIGGGIAGCISAYKLQQTGHDVTLFEKAEAVGQGGSGNRIGLIKPRLSKEVSFNSIAYLQSTVFYDNLPLEVWKGDRGIFQMCKFDDEVELFKSYINSGVLPEHDFQYLTAQEATAKLGLNVQRDGFWYPRAGCVAPSSLCQSIANSLNVEINAPVKNLTRDGNGWLVNEQKFEKVVIATAGQVTSLFDKCQLPLAGRRGQVAYLKAEKPLSDLKFGLSAHGYLTPVFDGEQLFGATFDRWDDFYDESYREITDQSEQDNSSKFEKVFPDLKPEITGARAGIRANTKDHLPIVGPLFQDDWFATEYEMLKHGSKAKRFEEAQYEEGLYIINGLGARGLQNAPILADILLSYINGSPCPVPRDVREKLHPARFIIRDLKKGKK